MIYLADIELARRLERAEARASADFVQARALVSPELGAEWIEVAGAYAMYDGVGSPMTQTFGLGLFDPVTAADMEKLERFFQDRGAVVFHEICPLSDAALLRLLNQRGYHPCELSNVLYRPIEGFRADAPCNELIHARRIETGEEDLWARTAASGWSDVAAGLVDIILGLGPINARRADTYCFLVEYGSQPIAAGALAVSDGVALLAGASTVPAYRNQGAQRALLETRLQYAAQQGCDLAMLCALPGSPSQRNGERQGFRIAYTRTKWQLG
jgi:GNAT superfamily N-acetyltransferase